MNRRRQFKRNGHSLLARLLDAAQRRFRRARPGSVLVMVVALLVMLALIGTAAMSTARLDRMSSVQHVKNTQLDILAEGVKNMAIAVVVSDLFGSGGGMYRDPYTDATTYDHYDYPGSFFSSPVNAALEQADSNSITAAGESKSFDAWLASRLPEKDPTTSPYWRFLSYPSMRSGNGYQVDAPDQGTSGIVVMPKDAYVPTYLKIGGFDYPALQPLNPGVANPFGVKGAPFLAGDADGDGAADSFMFKLATIGNLTYYGSFRIIDNNSAINVNTALVRDADFTVLSNTTKPVPNDGIFPSNIGMAEFLATYAPAFTDMNSVGTEFNKTLIRKNLATPPDGVVGGNGTPIAEDGSPLGSFKYRTVADAVYMGLGRRLDYPARVSTAGPGSPYYGNGTRPYGFSDGFAMAYRFCLKSSTNTSLESDLFQSTSARTSPYTPAAFGGYNGAINTWYAENFDYTILPPALPPPVRSVFVTHNPTSNAAPSHSVNPKVLFPNMQATPAFPVKISINTAAYPDLWRGFYEVMCTSDLTTGLGRNAAEAATTDNLSDSLNDTYLGTKFTSPAVASPTPAGPPGPGPAAKPYPQPFPSISELHPGQMFRNPIRNANGANEPRLTARQVMALRSALAAVNTMALRGGSNQVIIQPLKLDGVNGGKSYDVALYGYARQPFITEVFAHTDVNKVVPTDPKDARVPFQGKSNQLGFVAIELYNPYDVEIDLTGWQIATMDRGVYPRALDFIKDASSKDVTQEFNGVKIQPGEYLVIHNYKLNAADGDPEKPAQYWPFSSVQPPAGARMIYVSGLSSVLPTAANQAKEMVLLRPPAGNAVPANKDQLYVMVPVDSFDFTGLVLPAGDPNDPTVRPIAEAWHYTRANDKGANKAWAFVYPGRYNGSLGSRRHQGTEAERWNPGATPPEDEPWAPLGAPSNPGIKLGLPDDRSTRNPQNADDIKDFQIQLANTDMPGPASFGGASAYPFGGFARAGDMLQIPFIGAYAIFDSSLGAQPNASMVEMNAVTMDSVFAEDTDTVDDKVEDIGRFCPVTIAANNAVPSNTSLDVDDFDPRGSYILAAGKPPPKPLYHYRWSMRLFDYFTAINNPSDDYLPNMGAAAGGPLVPNSAVPNGPAITSAAQANGQNELTTPVEGLVNVNTAGWKVLSAVPFAPPSTPAVPGPVKLNEMIAKSIVYYRDNSDPATGTPHGPFASLLELNRVPIYANVYDPTTFQGFFQDVWKGASDHDADDADGDFSPAGVGITDAVRDDFKEKFLMVNRVSNLLALRSDTFTAYILVQGWRNAGSANATLEGQRRLAVIIDRSRITPVKKTATVYNVPTAN